jgi:hypothetical protein
VEHTGGRGILRSWDSWDTFFKKSFVEELSFRGHDIFLGDTFLKEEHPLHKH